MEKFYINHTDFADLSDEILREGNDLRFVAHGSSMAPFIVDGDILTIQQVDLTELREGRVVFYRTGGDALIAHRIIKLENGDGRLMLRTRGDCSPGSEEVVASDQLLGLVVSIQRGERVIQLNHGIWKTVGLLWTRLHPFPYLFYQVARKLGSSLRGSEHF